MGHYIGVRCPYGHVVLPRVQPVWGTYTCSVHPLYIRSAQDDFEVMLGPNLAYTSKVPTCGYLSHSILGLPTFIRFCSLDGALRHVTQSMLLGGDATDITECAVPKTDPFSLAAGAVSHTNVLY